MPDQAVSSADTAPVKRARVDHPFFAYMATQADHRVEPSAPRDTTRQRLSREIKAYLKTAQIGISEDPLKWWGMRAATLPILAQVAKVILAVPASSAPCERVFSKLARVNSKERSQMNPDLSNALLMC